MVWGAAAVWQAEIVVRSENHDRQRCKPAYEQHLWEDLRRLGVDFPATFDLDRGTPSRYRQSDCRQEYLLALRELEKQGLVYACECSRGSLKSANAPFSPSGELIYPGICRSKNIAIDKGLTLRLRIDEEAIVQWRDFSCATLLREEPHKGCGDMPLVDKHGNFTYQMCVVLDDIRHGITHIVRGQDVAASTARQVYLRQILGAPNDVLFYHHPLLTDEEGQKLGKRFRSTPVRAMLAEGNSPKSVIGDAAFIGGLTPSCMQLSWEEGVELTANFLKNKLK